MFHTWKISLPNGTNATVVVDIEINEGLDLIKDKSVFEQRRILQEVVERWMLETLSEKFPSPPLVATVQ